MTIFYIQPYQVGEVQQLIQRWKLVCSDTLSQVTTSGYLNTENLMGYTISPLDIIDCQYACTGTASNPGSGTYVELLPTITHSLGTAIITLNEVSGSGVPVSVTGDLVSFSNTTGGLADSGILATNVVSKAAVNVMAAGSEIILDKSTGTVSTGAVTINKQSGVITGTFTTAAAGTTSVTFNNSEIVASSVILVSLMGGTNAIPGVQLSCAYASAGVATLVVTNNNVAGSALSGTLIIGFVVL